MAVAFGINPSRFVGIKTTPLLIRRGETIQFGVRAGVTGEGMKREKGKESK